jgi:hypothetical protein
MPHKDKETRRAKQREYSKRHYYKFREKRIARVTAWLKTEKGKAIRKAVNAKYYAANRAVIDARKKARDRAAKDVAVIRAKRPGFGGGSVTNWYDAEIYPSDTYPAIPRPWFEKLDGGRLVGPGWRQYASQAEADKAAVRAAGRLARALAQNSEPQPEGK